MSLETQRNAKGAQRPRLFARVAARERGKGYAQLPEGSWARLLGSRVLGAQRCCALVVYSGLLRLALGGKGVAGAILER